MEVASVDSCMCPTAGTEETIPCDALILSVGLIPENELAQSIHVPLDPKTKGAIVGRTERNHAGGRFRLRQTRCMSTILWITFPKAAKLPA